MKTLIAKYIEGKAKAWTPSTLRSEEARLNAVAGLIDGNADKLWMALVRDGMKPYSRVTTWTRVVSFYQWGLDRGHFKGLNNYKLFREENARQFKNAYQPRTPSLSFEEAKALIQGLSDTAIRGKAMELLFSGMRYSESFTFTRHNNEVVGKGGKRRAVYLPAGEGSNYQNSYSTFLRALKRLGLTPHQLRKLAATELSRQGLREADLLEVMGWESILTAKAYLQPLKKEQLRDVFNKLQGGSKDERQQVPRKI